MTPASQYQDLRNALDRMTPERQMFDGVAGYMQAAMLVTTYEQAYEAAELKFGADVVLAWANDTIRQLRRVVPDNEYPFTAAVLAQAQAEKEN